MCTVCLRRGHLAGGLLKARAHLHPSWRGHAGGLRLGLLHRRAQEQCADSGTQHLPPVQVRARCYAGIVVGAGGHNTLPARSRPQLRLARLA